MVKEENITILTEAVYLEWMQAFLDIFEFSSNCYDSKVIFETVADKIAHFSNCEKVVNYIYKKNIKPEKYLIYEKHDLTNKKETLLIKENIYSGTDHIGELWLYYYDNKPIENIDIAVKLFSKSIGVIAKRFYDAIELQESQMKTIISALANDYGNITFVDLIKGNDVIIKANTNGVLVKDDADNLNYNQRIEHYVDNFVIDEEKEEMRSALSLPVAIEKVKNGDMYSVHCRIMIEGKIHYRTVKFVPQIRNGVVIGIVIGFYSTDSEHKYQEQLEAALKKAEVANTAKTSFLFNMSHDIRTPMNAIIGLAGLAKRHISEEEKVRDYLEKISIAGDQLLRLINNVLEMSRIESGNITLDKKPFGLVEKLHSNAVVFTEMCTQKGLNFHFSTSNITHNTIITDPDRIDQIINNLLGNATKYTNEGGDVIFRVSQEPGNNPDTCITKFVVEDTGIGMSKEFVSHIFDEFSRENTSTISHIEGTGLGMSIVKKVVDLLGGTITVESEKNVGTKITFVLETEFEKTKLSLDKQIETGFSYVRGLKILLVEDNELNREISYEILTENGMFVTCAKDGKEAVEIMKKADPLAFDVILMDIQMPIMDGYEATREIRKMPHVAKIPIIALSANAFEEDRQKSLSVGMNDHVAKPINAKKLIETLLRLGN